MTEASNDRPLGVNQRNMLDSLRRHGKWQENPLGTDRWVYGSRSETKRLLNSLVARGLVALDETATYRPK